MKKFFFCYFFFLLISFNIHSQNNYKEYHLNLIKSRNSENIDSIIYYQLNAIKAAKPFPKDLISIAFNYYKKNNIKKASHYFCLAFKYGYQIEPDVDFENLPYKGEYDFGFIHKYESINTPYAQFMNLMYSKNKRKIKKARKEFIKKNSKIDDSKYEVLLQNEYNFQKIRLSILPKIQLADSTVNILHKYLNIGNSYYFLNLLKKNEFPDRLKCRRFNEQNINILLNHAISSFSNKDDAKLFIDLLWEQVEIGNISPSDYAKAIDQYTQWYENSDFTLLGTTTISTDDFKTFQCKDVLYPDKLNELRKQFWLESIETYCKYTKFILPKNYIK